jgi:hypothetical protein
MGDWREQEAINQTVFREMNEWTNEEIENDSIDRLINTYLCECSDRLCTDPIQLTSSEYAAVRAVPINFAIALNHENPELDAVLAEYRRYAVVEKVPLFAAQIARRSDPRR